MTDYRLIMTLLVQQRPYRQIEDLASCSHRTIARAKRVLDEEHITTEEQIAAFSAEDLDRLFTDGRRAITSEFVPIDIDAVIAARVGRKKPPLKVLWSQYVKTPASAGARFYGYDRFCEIITEHARTHDLTAPIAHLPGHSMQVDWAGTPMQLTDPISRQHTRVSVFVATLPYSGMVFAWGSLDEKQAAWLDAHRRALEFFGGVPMVIIPDNASTASNQLSHSERVRDVNPVYAEFLEHYGTAAVPTRTYRPRDKGHVEAGVKVVTNWVIHFLADRVFTSLDDLNTAITEQIDVINHRTPFRGESRSRWDWFIEQERAELSALPTQRWEPVVWRKARVHRDWHIQIDTIKYSVPYTYAGRDVEIRMIGSHLDVLADGQVIASHQVGTTRNAYVTDPAHAPAFTADSEGLWTRGYFMRHAAKIGPATVTALERLLDARRIEAQGFRACMNILDLGKRGNRLLLERACQALIDSDPPRSVSYTAVKHQLALVRTELDARPRTTTAADTRPPVVGSEGFGLRDTSGAHLAGAAAFRLDALTRAPKDGGKDE
ncbi:IS21 family transposase [Gulosibacter chungangensis]|uniref:IS21 family transposase n=1 Tax=Gulosibacter chungangensis TaxID=979746 RepID=A0A7J5B796_9MICO|nr:IS21 family transposase [Gulosibacter chungangensis]KAB1640411.1 IS21 family transposase [Gulosibacter chungangensis]